MPPSRLFGSKSSWLGAFVDPRGGFFDIKKTSNPQLIWPKTPPKPPSSERRLRRAAPYGYAADIAEPPKHRPADKKKLNPKNLHGVDFGKHTDGEPDGGGAASQYKP
jgi:hypothetical protein